ncbi:four helix bundle protein [Desulfonatronovibrio hydrogenovorans]|uniref:four helix bundle protein n=1 Tax=Desulfonatronovibrio hydrogenovorans TaxID=53245 RepID=UPI001378F3B0
MEGCSQNEDKELAHFVNISFGSQAETKYLLHPASSMKHQDESISADIERPVRSFWPKTLEFLSASKQGRTA